MLKQDGLVPDKVIYTTLIHGYIDNYEFERAWNTFNGLRIQGVLNADQLTYGAMIDVCAQVQEIENEGKTKTICSILLFISKFRLKKSKELSFCGKK